MGLGLLSATFTTFTLFKFENYKFKVACASFHKY